MDKRKIKLWRWILAISVLLIFLMIVVSEAITIGERLRSRSVGLEIFYYILLLVVLVVGIVYPIFGVFAAPVFSLDKLHTADGRARKKWCRLLTANLLKNVELTAEEQAEIRTYLSMEDLADDRLIEFYDRKIRPQINAEIYETAKKVLIITSISQNSLYDTLGMAVANFNLVRRIVEICGFRPTTLQVMRLYVRVMSYSLLAGTLEDLNIEELLPFITESSLGKIGGIVAASAAQGVMNALMTLRIAMITKNYLLNADVSQTRKELRKKSFAEAVSLLKEIASDSFEKHVTAPVKGALHIGKKKEQES